MVNIVNNRNDGRTLMSDSANICAVDWWSRYDVENHVGRRISDDEWERIADLLEKHMKADMELLDFCITQSGVK